MSERTGACRPCNGLGELPRIVPGTVIEVNWELLPEESLALEQSNIVEGERHVRRYMTITYQLCGTCMGTGWVGEGADEIGHYCGLHDEGGIKHHGNA